MGKLSLKNTKLVLRILGVGWRIRKRAVLGYYTGMALEISAFIVSIYATAKLAGLLAHYVATGSTADIWLWLWIDIAAGASIAIAFWIMEWAKRLLYFSITGWSTREFLATLCRLDIPSFYDEETRNAINKAQAGYIWQLPVFHSTSLELIYAIARFTATAVIVAQISWWLIPLIALFLLPTLFVENRLAKVMWFVWDSKGDERHIFWGLEWIIRQPKNQMELRSSQAQKYVLDKIDAMNKRFYRTQEQAFKRANRFLPLTKILEATGTAAGAIVVLRQFLSGAISLERYFFLSGALLRIGGALNNIFGTLGRMQESLLFAENYFQVIDTMPKQVDKKRAVSLPQNTAPEIVFDHVSFTYPGQTKPVFKDLSFRISASEHIAIVGENGAGKSTLIKLLLRFYEPNSGKILIDGVDLQDVSIESWYSRLATLFQEFNQYPFPISENIEVGRPEHKGDTERLERAAQFSDVDELVTKYPHGWDTVLDNSFEKGIEPSGGQWQRVALARAFYRGADALILDEPTAAIDAKAEYDIFNNIFDHYQQKTAIIVSHRFSTVRRADTIFVIDEGKLLEQGSHQELMKEKGLYHELFTKQAEGYQD